MQLSSNFCNLFKLIATSHAKLLPETDSFQVICKGNAEGDLAAGSATWCNSSSEG